jgi:hypothetical protein
VVCVKTLVLLLALQATVAGPQEGESILLKLVNAERTQRGLRPLAWNPELASLARDHAEGMAATGTVSHLAGDGSSFARRAMKAGLAATAVAENVALDRTPASAHRSLMESVEHRANILDPDLTTIGIGAVYDPNHDVVYVVQDFTATSMTETDAAAKLRKALQDERAGFGLPALLEDRGLSRRLAVMLETMIEGDSLEFDRSTLPAPGWILSWTTVNPASLPPSVSDAIDIATSFGFSASFRRTRSRPLGAYWVIVVFPLWSVADPAE